MSVLPTPNAQESVKVLIIEGYQMLEYIARHGELTIDPKVAAGIYRANERFNGNQWGVADDMVLLQCYDQLAKQIYPVTLESLIAVKPQIERRQWLAPSAGNVINWYRRYTVLTLILLLIVQMYALFGYALTDGLNAKKATLMVTWPDDVQANYQLLKAWNRIWLLGQALPVPAESARSVHLSTQLIAAQGVLQMLQIYILPLMYGLLGAFIFVLRSLLYQVRTLTYTASREVAYRLRLTLGCLAGMITGWLMKPELGDMTLSPMALAFLSGYSVDVLFTVLDRFIDQIRYSDSVAKVAPRSSD
nr:hypothetical protein [Vibrio ostreicida]